MWRVKIDCVADKAPGERINDQDISIRRCEEGWAIFHDNGLAWTPTTGGPNIYPDEKSAISDVEENYKEPGWKIGKWTNEEEREGVGG